MTVDPYVIVCPYCGGTEVIETRQTGSVYASGNPWAACFLCHSICSGCGSVLRAYVKEPEKLLKKKDRKEN